MKFWDHTHTYTHAHTHIHMHTHKHTDTRTHTHTNAKTQAHTRAHTHAFACTCCAYDGLRQFFSVASNAPTLVAACVFISFFPHVKLDWSQLMCQKLPLKCKNFSCLVSCSINPLPSFSFPHSLSTFTSRWKNAAWCMFIGSASILVALIAALRCPAALRMKVCTCLSLGVLLEWTYFLPVLS